MPRGVASSRMWRIQVMALCFLTTNPMSAQSARDAGRCERVAGSISTNFIDETTTLGTATGDLRGAISALVLGPPEPGSNQTLIFNNQPRWVTEAGDTIRFANTQTTSVAVEPGLLAIVAYPLHIVGGTGKFAGASGRLDSIGEVDFRDPNNGRAVARYRGTVCFGK